MDDIDNDLLEDKPRTAEETARRCIVLSAVVAAGHGEPRDQLAAWLRREALWDAVSPGEIELLTAPSLDRRQTNSATWRAESLFTLLWALRKIDRLPPPTAICDVALMRSALPPLLESTAGFTASPALRSVEEISTALENTYQAHWKVRDAQIHDKPAPGGLNAGILFERHYALNWLTGYFAQDWDDVTTDT